MSSTKRMLTKQQKAAIETKSVSISLSAGAGCGKTFVLTQRFLAYLQPDTDPRETGADPLSQIVAITFTERAAREMRDRIRSACSDQLKNCSESEVPHWLSILRRIDAARISTIHSFCASFLRRHAVEAGIDPQFRLADEADGDALLRLTVSRSVRRLLENEDPDCLALLFNYGFDRICRTIQGLLVGQSMIDAEPFLNREPAAIAAEWTRHLNEHFLPDLIREFGESDTAKNVLDLLRENEPSNAVMQQRRAILLDRLPLIRSTEPLSSVDLLQEIRDAAMVQGGGNKKSWASEEAYESLKKSFEQIRKQIDKIREFSAFEHSELLRAAELSAAAAKVVRAVAAAYSDAKTEAGILDFDDLLVRTRDLLRVELLRKQASASIAALLVDEFQDTDPVQSEIVRLLVGGSLQNGKLFVVGDTKQSIYRFRHADPTVFDTMRANVPDKGQLSLSVNFRSQPEILNFINAVFAPALKESYEPLVPHLKQVSSGPTIEFLFASPSLEETTSTDDEAADSVADRRRREAEWMAGRIVELLADPTPRIPDESTSAGKIELRRVRPGDIAILFRALSDVAIYEEVFRKSGIDYYLVGGRAFFAQQEVYDLVNLCGFLNDPDDAISLVGILRSPFFSLDDDTLFALAAHGSSLRDALDGPVPDGLPETQQEQVRCAGRVLNDLLAKKDRLPLAILLQLAIDQTAYDASLLHEFLGRRKVANLRKLIEMARQFDRGGLGTLSDFVQRLRDSISEETIEELAATHPETSEVVRLMTIHQAKGLEFPVVVVADMDRPSRGASREAVYHREFGPLLPLPVLGDATPRHIALDMSKHVEDREDRQESLRILYVALTRAADHLILSTGFSADRRPRSAWLKLLAERFDLETGLPKGDPYFGSTSAGTAKSATSVPKILVHHQAPALATIKKDSPRPAPLSQFREIVESGEPGPLPPLLQPVRATRSSRPMLSVSAIDQADALLQRTPVGRERPIVNDLPGEVDELAAEDATELGTLVHQVIEHLDEQNAGRIDSLIDVVLKGLSGIPSGPTNAEHVRRRVEAFVHSSVWIEITAAERSFREIDFLLQWPPDPAETELAVITGKLDCLLHAADGTWKILDYKTGRVPSNDPAAIADHFAIQLVLYAHAVHAMIGRFPEAIEIVALHDEVRRFPLLLWPELIEQVSRRIDVAVRRLLMLDGQAKAAVSQH